MLADRLRQAATPKDVGPSQQAYVLTGTYTFTVPAGVTSICAVAVGGGGSANGNYYPSEDTPGVGGNLCYSNNIAVTPGESLTVQVADQGGSPNSSSPSWIKRGTTVLLWAQSRRYSSNDVGDVKNLGGEIIFPNGYGISTGGGGAAGYSGNGGTGGNSNAGGGDGAGGGGAGGSGGTNRQFELIVGVYLKEGVTAGAGGGGVGILGVGSSGTSGGVSGAFAFGGGGGSGGSNGGSNGFDIYAGNGGLYGGGGGARGYFTEYNWDDNTQEWVPYAVTSGTFGIGARGAVRIIWGAGRSYPSNAANV